MAEPFITVEEVVKITTLSKSTVYALVGSGVIPHLRLGARVVFDRSELALWLESQRRPVKVV